MEITEVRVRLVRDERDRKLRAFCSVLFDNAFVVRDLKVVEGDKGTFVAMPSRELADNCYFCKGSNRLRARYCSWCGEPLDKDRYTPREDGEGWSHLYVDVAHPITTSMRKIVEGTVLGAYEKERKKSSFELGVFDGTSTPTVSTVSASGTSSPTFTG